MTDPVRMVHDGATPFEQELLNSVWQEPVPPELQAQMASSIGLGPLASGSVIPGPVTPGAGVSGALKAQVASGVSFFKVAALSLGLSSAGAIGFGVWSSTRPAASSGAIAASSAVDGSAVERAAGDSAAGVEGAAVGPNAAGARSGGVNAKATSAVGLRRDARSADARVESPGPVSQVPGAQDRAPERGAVVVPPAEGAQQPAADEPAKVISSRPHAGARGARSAAGDDFIEKELRLLDPARAALQRGDRARAVRLLDEYDRRFPDGHLRREANLLRASTQPK